MGVDAKPYGQYIYTHNDTIYKISDHPRRFEYMRSSGVYIISNRTLLEWIARNKRDGWNGEHRSLMRDFITPLIHTGTVVPYRLPDEGYWDDAEIISSDGLNQYSTRVYNKT